MLAFYQRCQQPAAMQSRCESTLWVWLVLTRCYRQAGWVNVDGSADTSGSKPAEAHPGHAGTTIAGYHELEKSGVRSGLINAVLAATNRADEISRL